MKTRFAAMVHGAVKCLELTPLIPKLADKVRPCDYCQGLGWNERREGGSDPCMSCSCLGGSER